MSLAIIIALLALSYICGSIPFSYLVGRTQGIDLRKVGSGNTGASNVWRAIGFKSFVVALALDILKGFVPTMISNHVLHLSPWVTVAVGLAAIAGHVFPLFMHFHGGKSVATTGGVMLAIHPILLLASAIVWSIIYKLTGYPSVSSLLGIVIIAMASTVMAMMGMLHAAFSVFIWVSLLIMFYLHRANIQRLMQGTENRIEHKAK